MNESAVIMLQGVRVHNLQNVDVTIPLRKFTVVTGVSGAGKSSLVFDTLYAEAQRRYLQSFSVYTRQFLERFDKPDADYISDLPPAVAIRHKKTTNPRATVGTLTEIDDVLRTIFARLGKVVCRQCGQAVQAHRIADVLAAACGEAPGAKLMIAFPNQPDGDPTEWASALKEEGFVRVSVDGEVFRVDEYVSKWRSEDSPLIVLDRIEVGKNPSARITDSVETAWIRGLGRMALISGQTVTTFDRQWRCARCDILYPAPEPRLFDFCDPLGACPTCAGTGTDSSRKIELDQQPCRTCNGSRLNQQALNVRVANRTISEFSESKMDELQAYLASQELSESAAAEPVLFAELQSRLSCIVDANVGYLRLSLGLRDLSFSETMRLRMAKAIAAGMVNTLFALEEPGADLHSSEVESQIATLRRLRDLGNTIVAVEHHPDLIRGADYVIDLGPGAGEKGGRLTYQGKPTGLIDCDESATGGYLSEDQPIAKSRCRQPSGFIEYASHRFPLGVLCILSSPSSSGLLSVIERELYPALSDTKTTVKGAGRISEVVWMDQSPLTRSVRSNAVTYIKAFDEIRKTFASTTEAKIRNFGPSRFSFNQPGGRCERCEGQGRLTVDMQFLSDVTATCPDCDGDRFQPDVLSVKVRNLSIADVLNLTAREAFRFFRGQVGVQKRLKWLLDVGLEYIRLGQPTDTLSGGECQRLKLAGRLSSSRKSGCLFLLMEPSIGLHLADVEVLLECFHRLVDEGHSLIVVDNHSELVAAADEVIEF